MQIRYRVNQTVSDFYGKIRKTDYEDVILTLLAIAIVNYIKNIILNWQHPEIVDFDMEVLKWLIFGYIVLTTIRGLRKHFLERGVLSNERFLVEIQKLRKEVAKLV